MRSASLLTLTSLVVLAACGSRDKKTDAADTTGTAAVPAAPAANASPAFDLSTVAISTAPLGDFPYFKLPEGYGNSEKNPIVYFDRFYVWTGTHFERPEGKIFWSRITATGSKTYSDLEVTNSLSDQITAVGGVKVSEATVPADSASAIDETRRVKYHTGFGFIGYKPTTTYLVRREDRNIWVQVTPTDDGASAGWAVVETKPVEVKK